MNSPACNIRAEIARAGPITFARFMELALYSPGCGYYERRRAIGRRGDFFTSVSVGPVFGELLAFQFADWLNEIDAHKLQLAEAAAHEGQLATDILRWLRTHRPELFSRLEYIIVEPSPERQSWQAESLGEFPNVKWVSSLAELEQPGVTGIIFSNELLDAMPVHRLFWNAGEKHWQESRVTWDGSQFIWTLATPASELTDFIPEIPADLAAVLPEGYIVEISPAALQWWAQAAKTLRHGKLLTLDYGFGDGEWLRPERAAGTLRAYRDHQATHDILQNPGEQDLTAHVNFPLVRQAGEGTGLRTGAFVSQSQFLTQILARTQNPAAGFQPWTPARLQQFKTLTHPEHLGHRFRVLIQERHF